MVGSLKDRRVVLRYAMMIGNQLEFIDSFRSTETQFANKDWRTFSKMEMAVICLLHAELRIGEAILTRLAQMAVDVSYISELFV